MHDALHGPASDPNMAHHHPMTHHPATPAPASCITQIGIDTFQLTGIGIGIETFKSCRNW